MRPPIVLLLAGFFLLSGCIESGLVSDERRPPGEIYGWSWTAEDSMYPDFSTSGEETFQALILHNHLLPSKRQEEYNREHPVVCSSLDLEEVLEPITSRIPGPGRSVEAAADMVPCAPIADPATGRLFMDPAEFDELDAIAIALVDPLCYGELYSIRSDSPGLNEDVGEHSFRIEFLQNDTLVIDGTRYLEPGRVFKASFWVAGDDPDSTDDDHEVRAIFDYPGRWLASMVALPDLGEIPPPRPPQGNGPQANVSRAAAHVEDILEPLLQATAGSQETLAGFRAVRASGILVDLSVQVVSGNETTDWFVAGGDASQLRLLGQVRASNGSESRADPASFGAAFATLTLSDFDAGSGSGSATVFLWAPERALAPVSEAAPWVETWIPPPAACDGDCAFVWAADPFGETSWRRVRDPNEVASEDAFTFAARGYPQAGTAQFQERLYYFPG